MDFDGKRCIVTGAAMGIGRAVAEELLERGAKCIIADINWKVRDTNSEYKHTQRHASLKLSDVTPRTFEHDDALPFQIHM